MRWIFRFNVAASLVLVAVALHKWGAAEIRANGGEVLFLTLAGAVLILIATKIFPWLGVSVRDDVFDQRNEAALAAVCGAEMAVAIIYTGGSVGEGPSYLENFFCTILGTGSLAVLWLLLEVGGKISRSITEDRDLASGIRACGFLVAAGLLFARALAGDWESASATMEDFVRDGWPAIPLCASAVVIEKFARPSRIRPFPTWPEFGLMPALLYLGLVAVWLFHLGPWQGMP
jgi:hypothetical protein